MTFPDTLRAAGLRVTRQRIAVLQALEGSGHLDAEHVRQKVVAQVGSVSTQTVYDVLSVLNEHQLVRRIEPAGSPARYELRVGDNHHHLVCRSCGRIEDVDCATQAPPCLSLTNNHGFAVDEAEVTWWGQCPACRAA